MPTNVLADPQPLNDTLSLHLRMPGQSGWAYPPSWTQAQLDRLAELCRDRRWAAAIHIFSLPRLSTGSIWMHVDPLRGAIDYNAILEECSSMSSGEAALVKVAVSCGSWYYSVSLNETISLLGGEFRNRALEAISML